MLGRAQDILAGRWPFLVSEPDLADDDRKSAEKLDDLMQKESFYRELPMIDQLTAQLEKLYGDRFQTAVKARADCYKQAVEQLHATPGWEQLDADRQGRIAQPLASRATTDVSMSMPIPQLRADVDACPKRLGRRRGRSPPAR